MTAPYAQPPQPPTDDPLVSTDFTSWFGKVVDAVGRSWLPVAVLQLVTSLPTLVFAVLFLRASGLNLLSSSELNESGELHIHDVAGSTAYGAGYVVVGLALTAVTLQASIWLVVHHAAGVPAPIAAALRFGLRRAPWTIGWLLLTLVLIVAGLLVFLVPGVYLAVVIVPTLFGVIAVERRGIGRCFQLARGRFWALFGRAAIFLLAAFVFSQIVTLVAKIAFGDDGRPVWGVLVVSAVLQAPFGAVTVAFLVVTYAEARAAVDGLTTDGLVRALAGGR